MKNYTNPSSSSLLTNKLFHSIVIAFIISFLSSCGSLAPLKERDAAIASIALASQAEAKRLAQQDFSNAEGEFNIGENTIVRDKKSSQNDQAKKNYTNAKLLADQALQTALMQLIEETDALIESKTPLALENNQENILEMAEIENENARTTLAENNYNQTLENIRAARSLLEQIQSLSKVTPEEVREKVESEETVTLIKETPRYYIVKLRKQKRDSLWRISENFFEDPLRWPEIYQLNENLIQDPDLIYPGQRLLLPKQ